MSPETTSRLSDSDLAEIESLARANTGEPYRGPLLALVDEVRRLRSVVSSAGLVSCNGPGSAGQEAGSTQGSA